MAALDDLRLGDKRVVIAPDLRGAGASEVTPSGYEKKNLAQDIHAMVQALGYRKVNIVGHDIGLMVAMRLRGAVPGRSGERDADGCVPARRGRLAEGLAAARQVALQFLRRYAGEAGEGTRAHILRAFLERLRRRPGALGAGSQPAALRRGLRPAWPDARGVRILSCVPAGCRGFRCPGEAAAADAHAGAGRREGVR
ncbi:alpha/beta fold hydrolase [Cupriavidus basilensis]